MDLQTTSEAVVPPERVMVVLGVVLLAEPLASHCPSLVMGRGLHGASRQRGGGLCNASGGWADCLHEDELFRGDIVAGIEEAGNDTVVSAGRDAGVDAWRSASPGCRILTDGLKIERYAEIGGGWGALALLLSAPCERDSLHCEAAPRAEISFQEGGGLLRRGKVVVGQFRL